MNENPGFKKKIQQFWTKNVPLLDIASKQFGPEVKEFYIAADNYRFKYEANVIPFIESFLKPGLKILEVGCGFGSDSRYMNSHGGKVTSLDLSYDNVRFTTKGMKLMNLSGRGVCADAENLPFKDNSFDVTYSFGVLHHTPDTQKAINELYRVLKPNGQCAVLLYHKGYAYYVLLALHGYKRILRIYNKENMMSRYDNTPLSKMFSKKEVRNLFNKFSGVEIEISTYGGIQVHPLLKYVYKMLVTFKFLMNNFGTFLLIRGRKQG